MNNITFEVKSVPCVGVFVNDLNLSRWFAGGHPWQKLLVKNYGFRADRRTHGGNSIDIDSNDPDYWTDAYSYRIAVPLDQTKPTTLEGYEEVSFEEWKSNVLHGSDLSNWYYTIKSWSNQRGKFSPGTLKAIIEQEVWENWKEVRFYRPVAGLVDEKEWKVRVENRITNLLKKNRIWARNVSDNKDNWLEITKKSRLSEIVRSHAVWEISSDLEHWNKLSTF